MAVEPEPQRDSSGAGQAAADAVQGSVNAGWDHLDQVPGASDAIAMGVEQLAVGLGISHLAHAGDHVLGDFPLTPVAEAGAQGAGSIGGEVEISDNLRRLRAEAAANPGGEAARELARLRSWSETGRAVSSSARVAEDPTGQARVEPPTWGELEVVPDFNSAKAAATAELDGVAPDTERAQEFGAIYADLESYFWFQLHPPTYESVDYTLNQDAVDSLVYDFFDTEILELLEGKEIRLPSPKLEFSIPIPQPDSGFVRLSDTDQRRIIRLGITFEGESGGQPSGVQPFDNFGIEVDLAKTDGTVGIYKSQTFPDGTPQGKEERLRTEEAQATPDQMRNIARILDKYSQSGTITHRATRRARVVEVAGGGEGGALVADMSLVGDVLGADSSLVQE